MVVLTFAFSSLQFLDAIATLDVVEMRFVPPKGVGVNGMVGT